MVQSRLWNDEERARARDFITNLQLYGFLGWGILPSERYPAYPMGGWGIFPAWCRWFYSDDGVPTLANTDGLHTIVIEGRSWRIVRGGRIPVSSDGPRRIIGGVRVSAGPRYTDRGWLGRLLCDLGRAVVALCDHADAGAGVRRGTKWHDDERTVGHMFIEDAAATRRQSFAINIGAEDDGRYVADVTSHPGCMAYGATPEDAAHAAIDLAIEAIEDAHDMDALRT